MKLPIEFLMVKIKPVLMLLCVFCFLLIGWVSNAQQVHSESRMANLAGAKQALAIAVLSEAGISRRYNTYLGNSIDIAVAPETARKAKFMAWMQTLFVQEAGWSHVEAKYVDQLKANFSEKELKELLALTKQPLIRKLLRFEVEVYSNSAEQRRKLLFKLWNNYNSGMFNPPPEVLR